MPFPARDGWDPPGTWHPLPYVDEQAAELLFRKKVISRLASEGLLGPERVELLDAWKSGHTGFSAHNRVTLAPGDGAGLERLARYLLRAPLSLERLGLDGSIAHYNAENLALFWPWEAIPASLPSIGSGRPPGRRGWSSAPGRSPCCSTL